ncbi:MAG: hypothetical protein HY550_02395 [Elusimicrobia bacterium]|nr:hypothetical protein [Elusimicrobiota bacterium]
MSGRRLLFAAALFGLPACSAPVRQPAPVSLRAEDEAFLEDLSRRSFLYFAEQSDPGTGLVLDRARADGSQMDEAHRYVASSAATGFGLTAFCIAAGRGWLPREEAAVRARRALEFFAGKAAHERGWFYHWLDSRTGERVWNSEISSIDTALLLGGVLTAKQCFAGYPEIGALSDKIYSRLDFRWMLNGDPALLSHGWKPESGFLKFRWDTHAESMLLYLLGLGSPTSPLTRASWLAWKRPVVSYGGFTYISGAPPLFIHQYSQAWVDFRGTDDGGIDWFENSRLATRANRAMCLDLAQRFPGYGPELWGITASDGPSGYVAWGGPPATPDIDGTVVPCGPGGSLMFAPDLALPALKAMKAYGGGKAYGKYGFADAFNPATGWVDTDVLGIDAGITLLSAENLRGGSVWKWFMANKEIKAGLPAAGVKVAGKN